MKKLLSFIYLLLSFTSFSQVKSPEEFLGYPLGSRFTYHHQIISYSRYLAENSEGLAQWITYGQTSEHRELGQLLISNLPKGLSINEIQANHLNAIQGKNSDQSMPLIINLSFNVHGNEAAGSEAALKTMFQLVSSKNKSAYYVILIDPCLNPDGREAYVTQFNRRSFLTEGNADPNDQEHFEGNTTGRYNHFSFDLNRDWIWQMQKETQQRVKLYRSWMPMLHADFHEQSFQHTYYFPPAAKPYLNFLSPSTLELQANVSKSFSKLFDAKKWPYFTSEVYDLLYPGYGDTYPILNGALGMTLEQGGIRGGLNAAKNNGDSISLSARVEHHTSLALNLVEWSLANSEAIKLSFYGNHNKSRTNPTNRFKSYFIPDSELYKAKEFIELLEKNDIKYGYTQLTKPLLSAYAFKENKLINLPVQTGLFINARQTSSALIQALLDPNIVLEDSLTYDITAWNLFQLNGLKAYGLSEEISFKKDKYEIGPLKTNNSAEIGYSFYPSNFKSSQEFMRFALKSGGLLSYSDVQSGQITLLITKLLESQKNELVQMAASLKILLKPLTSFRSENGKDLGSTHFKTIFLPKIAVVVDPLNDVNQQGELAYFLTVKYGLKPSFIPLNQLFKANLFQYTHVIFPDGKYNKLSNTYAILLQDWMGTGGKLILVEGAHKILGGKDIEVKEDSVEHASTYEIQERAEISQTSAGNLLELDVEKTHPLAFRIDDQQMFIINQSSEFVTLKKGFTPILKTSSKPKIMGFIGTHKKQIVANSLMLGVQKVDKGKIIWFGFNPFFRAIPNQGQVIFENCFLFSEF